MGLFRRSAYTQAPSDSIPTTPPAGHEQQNANDTKPVDPFEFVERNSLYLENSTLLWRTIALRLNEYNGSGWTSTINDGLGAVHSAGGDADRVRQQQQIANGLALLTFMAARIVSTSTDVDIPMLIPQLINDKIDPEIQKIISGQNGDIATRIFEISDLMRNADMYGNNILKNMVDAYGGHPSGVQALGELYANGVGESSPLFKELRAIIAQDWHSHDSMLKQFIKNLQIEDEIFADDFIAEVVMGEQASRSYHTIFGMAKLAVSALVRYGHLDVTETQALRITYPDWRNVGDIAVAFRAYVGRRLLEIDKTLTSIAGSHNLKSIRDKCSKDRLNNFALQLSVGNNVRAAKRTKRGAIGPDAGNSTIIKEINAAKEKWVKPRIFQVKTTINGEKKYTAAEVDLDMLLDNFGIPRNDPKLRSDLTKVIQRLQSPEPFLGSGSCVSLDKKENGIFVDGKNLRLFRFAPNNATAIGISGENRYYRVVFRLDGDKLYIVDILNHRDFDGKY